MSTTNFSSSTEKYLYSRDAFRVRAREEFFYRRPSIKLLVFAINEYVASSMLALSGQDMRSIPNGLYIVDLVVSFTRTHFVTIDLIVCSELIDGATLLRKQFELLARLNQLQATETVEHLINRTPNLSSLRTQVKTLYGDYSQVAHSSAPQSLQLLGREEYGDGVFTVYGHIISGGILVQYGNEVAVGQQIAKVGSTGGSTGCHLHFGVYVNGVVTNPVEYLRNQGITVG